MTKKLKKQLGKIMSIILSVAMLAGTLPADMLGGIASVKAAGAGGLVLNVSDLTAGDITAAGALGDSIFSAVGVDATNVFTVETNAKSADGLSFTQRLKLNGKGSTTTRAISFTPENAGTFVVYAMSGKSEETRNLELNDGTNVVATFATDGNCTKFTAQVAAKTTYYLYSANSGINLYYLALTEDGANPSSSSSESGSSGSESSEPSSSEQGGTGDGDEPAGVTIDPDKDLVFDFGAETLDETKYNNVLTADVINSWYPGVAPGTDGQTLASFQVKDTEGNLLVEFNDGGFPTTHRLRTTNQALTRKDSKSLKDTDGNVYNGYVYSNKTGSKDVYLGFGLKEGDIVTAVMGSNGTAFTANFQNANDADDIQTYENDIITSSGTAYKHTFYANADAEYKLYYSREKLVVARVIVEHTEEVAVSGSVTGSFPEGTTLEITCTETGKTVSVPINNGSYSTTLRNNYNYTVALGNANGYVIEEGNAFAIEADATAKTHDVKVKEVELIDVSGTITVDGKKVADDAAVATVLSAATAFKLTATDSTKIYVPEFKVNAAAGTFNVKVEPDTEYVLSVEGINDYEILNDKLNYAAAKDDAVIAITSKPVYAITIVPEGAELSALSTAEFTFTNMNEEGYVYNFTGTDNIKLRDGVYKVNVKNSGTAYPEDIANLTVEGAAAECPITFVSDVTAWDFASNNFADNFADGSYRGLTVTNGARHNSKSLLVAQGGTITVPVPTAEAGKALAVKVGTFYEWDYKFDEGEFIYKKNGSTKNPDGVEYNYYEVPADVTSVTITVKDQASGGHSSYFTSIEIIEVVPYTATLQVGADKTYKTINEALEAVSNMIGRTADQRVTIEIDPGDYEEMLVIDQPNVTLKNASATPSIELTNKGVDIDANAVRITSYYGHGYSYYSMNENCKYDEDVLAINKANGSASFTNPGSGTTAGSYWNATVCINADGFNAEGIIFENSFNQYVSKKAANDVIVAQSSAKEPKDAPRAGLPEGSTAVQDKAYVERAAALAIYNDCKQVSFDNCKFIGRQDTLYGGTGVTAAFYDCSVYGGTDYIFGGMTAVFAKCDLVFNTSENNNDVGYITAPQQKANADGSKPRGYLMYNCKVTSTVPGVDTASQYASKAGYLGRPWEANVGEAVFYETVIDASCEKYFRDSASLIKPEGWLNTLGGNSDRCLEYNTHEMAMDVTTKAALDNSASRAAWSGGVLETPTLADGTAISVAAFLGAWDAFAGKNMDIVVPDDAGTVDNTPDIDSVKFEASIFKDAPYNLGDKALIEEGITVGTLTTKEGSTDAPIFKIIGANNKKRVMQGMDSVEVDKWGQGAIQFTTAATSEIIVEATSTGGSNYSAILLVDVATGNSITGTGYATHDAAKVEHTECVNGNGANGPCVITYKDVPAGTYRIISPQDAKANRGVAVISIAIEGEKGTIVPAKTAWADVAAPVISSVAANAEDAAKVDVTVTVDLDYAGADSVRVEMYNAEGTKVGSGVAAVESAADTAVVTLAPPATGSYTFKAFAVRKGEEDKASAASEPFAFTLPLGNAEFITVSNAGKGDDGKGTAKAVWAPVPEATSYTITATEKDNEKAKPIVVDTEGIPVDADLCALVGGLTIDKTYVFTIVAHRGEETSQTPGTAELLVKANMEVAWGTTVYGSSTSASKASFEGDANNGPVTVASTGNGGKIVPASTDGLSFYYTKVPVDQNFTLKATVHADSWTYSNGQDGFGLLATDRLGSGDVEFWNNSYMLGFTKVEYRWLEGQITDSEDGAKINMHIGPGALEKTGLTPENLANFTQNPADGDVKMTQADAIKRWFNTSTTPLDTSMAAYGAGDYNIVANNQGGLANVTSYDWNDFNVTLEKNNTGYFLSYESRNGKTVTKKFYDPDALEHLDQDYVYVGFFAARNATATFSNIEFSTRDAATDKPAEPKPVTYYTPSYNVTSATVANTPEYEFKFASNWAGTLTVKDAAGKVLIDNMTLPTKDEENKVIYGPTTYRLSDEELEAGYKLISTITNTVNGTEAGKDLWLNVGENKFSVIFAPDKAYHPDNDELNQLKDYSISNFTHTVTYKAYGEEGQALYVAPDGKASGTGRKNSPLDIYTAVKYVQAGQTIILKEGTYSLSKTVRVERGINGTSNKPIKLIADPEAETRPVFDFNGACAGMVFGGDYWYIQGFDVTRSANGQKGVQISGSHNVVDDLHTYMNGNTGIQISRLYGSDTFNDWPADNRILNCDSYLNADAGYEDADGFAAKLTVGEGNVFEGCIAAYNADDGWDLFAKVQSGNIGKVVLNNCVAFKNGYVLLDREGGQLSVTGTYVQNAGNGNGFKLGGDSLSGFHELNNSYAFYNKAKGIDSNSCPDIQVKNSISFNNESYNVAFYTNTNPQTNFGAQGVISYKTADCLASTQSIENIAPKGDQVEQAWLVANDTMKSEAFIALYKALPDKVQSKFKATGKWADLTADDAATTAFKTAAAGFTDTEKEFCVKFMAGIAQFGDKYYAAADDAAKTALETELMNQPHQIFGAHNYYIFAGKTQNLLNDTVVDDTWFQNLTVTDFGDVVGRDADGKIYMKNGFLQLTDAAKAADAAMAGFGLTGTGSRDTADDDKIPETSGAVTGGLGKEDTTGVVPGDAPADGGEMEGLWIAFVDDVDDLVYTGKAIKPEIRVYHNTTRLTAADYSVSYSNNVNAYVADAVDESGNAIYDARKVPTIKVTGKGNFEGFITQSFDINPVDVDSDLIAAPSVTKVANGKAQNAVVPVLTYNGKKLANKRDFTLSYPSEGYTAAGSYDIKVTGKGNYTGETTVALNIIDKNNKNIVDIKKAKISTKNKSFFIFAPSYVYNGQAIEPEVSVLYTDPQTKAQRALVEGTDYTVTYANNVNVGTASIVVEGINDGNSGFYGSKTLTFKITAANLRDAVVISDQYAAASYRTTVYGGQPIVFSDLELVVRSNDGESDVETVLEADKDYTITYSGNNKAGTASFTVKGKGNYAGTLKRTFKISAYNLELDEWGPVGGSIVDTEPVVVAYAVSGAKIPVSVTVDGLVLKEGTDYVVSYKNNKKVNNNATVTVTGRNGFTGKITKTFSIAKKDLADPEEPLNMVVSDVTAKTKAAAPKAVVKIYDVNGKAIGSGEYVLTYFDADGREITGDKTFKPNVGEEFTVKATAKATSKNFVGELSGTCSVVGVDIKSASVKAFDKKYYTGSAITLGEEDFEYTDAKTGKLVSRVTYKGKSLWFGQDFEVVPGSYVNNVKAGTARFTIRGITSDFGGTKVVTFKINKKIVNMAKAVVTIDKTAGENVEDQLVVELNNLVLTKDVDYTVDTTQYATKNTVKIYGIGSYGGVKTVKVNKLKEAVK